MNDDERIVEWRADRALDAARLHLSAVNEPNVEERFKALVAENAALRAGAGRVPESWGECADWLEWFGADGSVFLRPDGGTEPIRNSPVTLRSWSHPVNPNYRLLPPPNLVAAPPGMDGGGYLGEGRHVPKGWGWTYGHQDYWGTDRRPPAHSLVQCRPPQPVVREVVEVPLTQLVGETIEGETEAVRRVDPPYVASALSQVWRWRPDAYPFRPFPDGTLDLDTGLVRVYKDGES